MKKYIIVAITLFCIISSMAQDQSQTFEEKTVQSFKKQLSSFPQEKIYLHFDKNHYVSGEKIWFRAYLLDASTHTQDTISRYIYVDLINPINTIVERVKIHPQFGAYSGNITLSDAIPSGNYTIRAYTNFMRNIGEEYFFKTTVTISNPISAKINTHIESIADDNEKKESFKLYFTDIASGEKRLPQTMKISNEELSDKKITATNNEYYKVPFRLNNDKKQDYMLVDYDKYCQYIKVPRKEEFSVSFFPEGGNLIANTSNIVAFKSLNSGGLSEEVSGEIFNSSDEKVLSFESSHKGMGSFALFPKSNEFYYVVCKNKNGESKRFDLKAASDNVIGLRADIYSGKFRISVNRPMNFEVKSDLFLIVHNRGKVYYSNPIKQDGIVALKLEDMPSGVTHFLLTDGEFNILSERLFFHLNNDLGQLKFSSDKPVYGNREKIISEFKITNPDGEILDGSFSISVTDDLDNAVDTTNNILTNLLLTSELKGYIEEPSFYLEQNAKSVAARDVLMLTQGWRRYDMQKLLKGERTKLTEALELGSMISGKVKGVLTGKPTVNSPVSMLIMPQGRLMITETDQDGKFLFNGFEYPDSTFYVVSALSKRNGNWVEVTLDKEISTPAPNSLPSKDNTLGSPKSKAEYIAKADRKWSIENGLRSVVLDEVNVVGFKQQKGNALSNFADNSYDSEYIERWNVSSLKMLLAMMPGIQVSEGIVTVRGGSGPPLFVIDDTPDETFDIDASIDISFIERIDLFKGGTIALWGSKGANGVIMITTKGGKIITNNKPVFNVQKATPLGHQAPVEFYTPTYETPEQKNSPKPDLRSTIHWIPNITTGENGKVSFEFYSADKPTTYSVIIEGLGYDGTIVHKVEKITVK